MVSPYMPIECRPILNSHEIEQIIDLHGLIWDTGDRDAIPAHMISAVRHAGGVVLAAWEAEHPIGFSLAFPGIRRNRVVLWSHATGVLPEYQGRGIGWALKQLQREMAIKQGFDCISWTFDPLQSGNANFNICHLGCVCTQYHDDFYGEVSDGLNQGLPTDRFEVEWWIKSPQVRSRSTGGNQHHAPDNQPIGYVVLTTDDTGACPAPIRVPDPTCTRAAVQIPSDINQLRSNDLDTALKWRLATRAAFHELFAQGYVVTGFVKKVGQNERQDAVYVLEKVPALLTP